MNYIIGDSRVRGFRGMIPNLDFQDIWARPGGHVRDMFELIDDLTILHHGEENSRAHFYISVGICDLTERLRGVNYDEVIFDKHQFLTRKGNLYNEFENLATAVTNQYAKPVFCTILPLSLSVWNTHRLTTNKTSHLVHAHEYPQMQKDLETEIGHLNNFLIGLNIRIGMSTPMMFRDIQHNRGRGRKITKYCELVDGCHPNRLLLDKCKRSLMTAYSKNKRINRH